MLKDQRCLVSGGGTNLQAIMDAMDAREDHEMPRLPRSSATMPEPTLWSGPKNHGIEAVCISPKDYEDQGGLQPRRCWIRWTAIRWILMVLAGFLVVIPRDHDREIPRTGSSISTRP